MTPEPHAHACFVEGALAETIREWRDRRECLDPGGARWVIAPRHIAVEGRARPGGGALRTGVDVIVPTSRACRGLAEFVRRCGLFGIESEEAPPENPAPIAGGSSQLNLRARSTRRPWPIVTVELTIRSALEHFRWTIVGGGALPACAGSAADAACLLVTRLELAEAHGLRIVEIRLLDDCSRTIEAAFTSAPPSGDDGHDATAREARCRGFVTRVSDLLRSAIRGAPAECAPALRDLRLLLGSIPREYEAGRRALAGAIARVELRRTELV